MTNKERIELAHWVAGQCQQAGADEAAVNIAYSRSVEVKHQNRKLDQLKESTQNSLNLNVYLGGRYSGHSTNDLSRDALAGFVKEAVAMTRHLSADADRSITDPKYYQDSQKIDLKIRDPQYGNITSEERVKFARRCEEATLARSDKVITCSGNYSDTAYESVKVHSNGFEGESGGTSYQAYSDVTVQGEGEGRPSDWYATVNRFRKELAAPEQLGQKAVARALAKVGQAKIESGKYDMIVENRAMSKLLGAMTGPLSGQNIYRKNSFLVDKLGEKIASEKLTVIDDPFVESGLGSQLYDGDGMAAEKRVIIEKGVLKSYLIDWYYSRKLKVEPTTGGTSNLIFEYGTKSLDELARQATRAILVRSFVGGNSNSTTGDHSYGVIGELVENGKIVKPVNEMNVSGNLTDLWDKLIETGNDPYPISGWRRPSMYFKDIQFAGL